MKHGINRVVAAVIDLAVHLSDAAAGAEQPLGLWILDVLFVVPSPAPVSAAPVDFDAVLVEQTLLLGDNVWHLVYGNVCQRYEHAILRVDVLHEHHDEQRRQDTACESACERN